MSNNMDDPFRMSAMNRSVESVQSVPSYQAKMDGTARIALLPWDEATQSAAQICAMLRSRIIEAKHFAATSDEALHRLLFQRAGAEQNDAKRKKLVSWQRSLRKGSLPAPPIDDEAILDAVAASTRWRSDVACLSLQLDDELAASTSREIAQLWREALDEDFLSTLALASIELFKLHLSSLDRPTSERTRRKLKTGLLKYTTRAKAKCTPFGRFSSIARFLLAEAAVHSGASSPSRRRPSVSVNRNILGDFLAELVADDDTLLWLDVSLNPTVRLNGDEVTWLHIVNGKEVFQRARISAPLLHLLGSAKAGEYYRLDSLFHLKPDLSGIARSAKIDYSRKLIQLGLIRVNTQTNAFHHDWPRRFANGVSDIQSEAAQSVAGRLRKLASFSESVANARPIEIEQLLSDALAYLPARAELATQNKIRTNVFYEDSYLDLTLRIKDTERAIAALGRTLEAIAFTAPQIVEQARLRQFFDGHFANQSPSLLEFYRAYSEYGKAKASADAPENASSTHTPVAKEQEALIATLAAFIKRAASTTSENVVDLCSEELAGLSREALKESPRPTSVGVHCLLVDDPKSSQGIQLVAKNVRGLLGFRKYSSRFLHQLPDLALTYRDENTSKQSDCLVELATDSNFNANIHPHLTNSVLDYPVTTERWDVEDVVGVEDLIVGEHSTLKQAVQLFRRTDRTVVVPVDLTFQNPTLRPPLYRLLASFQPPNGIGFDFGMPAKREIDPALLHGIAYGCDVANCFAFFSPRVTIDHALVVSRMTWELSACLIPKRAHSEPLSDFYMRLEAWRESLRLPQHIFVRGADRDPSKAPPRVRKSRGDANHFRPQYVDLSAILHWEVLSSYHDGSTSTFVRIEEALPSPNSAYTIGDAKYATEILLQYDLKR